MLWRGLNDLIGGLQHPPAAWVGYRNNALASADEISRGPLLFITEPAVFG